MKEIEFYGESLNTIRAFPAAVKREAGLQLDKIQRGYEPSTGNPCLRLEVAYAKFESKNKDSIG